jgi:hypothetical protein
VLLHVKEIALAERALAESDIPEYSRNRVLPCPRRVPSDLVEGSSVAIYFSDINQWCDGIMTQVDKRYKKKNNISVMFEGEGLWNFCVGTVNYGKLWLLLDETADAAQSRRDAMEIMPVDSSDDEL